MSDRRAFLKFLAASPLFAGIPAMLEAFAQESTLATAEAALDVFDFEAAARKVVPPAHWGYMATAWTGKTRSEPIEKASPGTSCGRAGSSMSAGLTCRRSSLE